MATVVIDLGTGVVGLDGSVDVGCDGLVELAFPVVGRERVEGLLTML